MPVNFRKLVPFFSGIDRATHLFHSYPAKLLLNIPFFFLHCQQLGRPLHLFDPFCGSGTVLVEGAFRGCCLTGADANPLARLITKVKLTHLDPASLDSALARISSASDLKPRTFSAVLDVNRWFSPRVQEQIGALLSAIDQEPRAHVRDFLRACLSSCLRKASFADPRLSVPVRSKPGSAQWTLARNVDFIDLFRTTVRTNRSRLERLTAMDRRALKSLHLLHDARCRPNGTSPHGAVDLIITSPPYVGAQKYIRASSLSIGWLALAPGDKLRALERVNIGREHYSRHEYSTPCFLPKTAASAVLKDIRAKNPLRAHIATTYLLEMRDALTASVRHLRRGGRLILVVGNNTIAGYRFETSKYLTEIVTSLGLRLELELIDEIRSRALMTQRNRGAAIIGREHIQVFFKP